MVYGSDLIATGLCMEAVWLYAVRGQAPVRRP